MDIHVLNTDRGHGAVGADAEWLRRGVAVTSGGENYAAKLRQIRSGDWILMWLNGRGVVAAGRAVDDRVQHVYPPNVVNSSEPEEYHRLMDWRLDLRSNPISAAEFTALSGVRPTSARVRIRDPERRAAVLARLAELERTADPTQYEMIADSMLALGPVSKPIGFTIPTRIEGTTNCFYRSPWVRAWTLQRAGRHCELCKSAAPFLKSSGLPYLESHHVVPMSEGGGDTPENTAALCPNCHRELHCGAERIEKREELKRIVLGQEMK